MNERQGIQRSKLAKTRLFLQALAIICVVSVPSESQAQIPCRYELQLLPNPAPCQFWDRYVTPTGISPNGRWVCGSTITCGFDPGYTEAVVVDTNTMHLQVLPPLEGVVSAWASDVNDADFVVGSYQTSAAQFGFIYDLNTNQYVHQLASAVPGGMCSIEGINASNVVCGTRTIQLSPQMTTAFRWSASTGYQELGVVDKQSTSAAAINDSSAVTGKLRMGDASRPFLWRNDQLVIVGSLDGLETFPTAISNSGRVVGQSATVPGGLQPHAFIADELSINDLGMLPRHKFSRAFDVSDDLVAVGLSVPFDSSEPNRAVIWIENQIYDLSTLAMLPANISGISSANAIAENGIIAASAFAPGTGFACLLKPLYALPADITADCSVNLSDLMLVITQWGHSKSNADINHDGIVNVPDLLAVISQWTFD